MREGGFALWVQLCCQVPVLPHDKACLDRGLCPLVFCTLVQDDAIPAPEGMFVSDVVHVVSRRKRKDGLTTCGRPSTPDLPWQPKHAWP